MVKHFPICYIARIDKSEENVSIRWDKMSPLDIPEQVEHSIQRDNIEISPSLRLYFSDISSKEEHDCGIKSFSKGIRAYLNKEKICILEISKEELLCDLDEIDPTTPSFIPLSFGGHIDEYVDTLSIYLVSLKSPNVSKIMNETKCCSMPASEEGYGSDIIFHCAKENKVYSIEVMLASSYLDLK